MHCSKVLRYMYNTNTQKYAWGGPRSMVMWSWSGFSHPMFLHAMSTSHVLLPSLYMSSPRTLLIIYFGMTELYAVSSHSQLC